jgi:hypothetical protein
MLERTAFWVYPIIKEIVAKMVKHKDLESLNKSAMTNKNEPDFKNLPKSQQINMKVLLGYLN